MGILDRRIDSHPRTHSRAARARQTIAARSVRHAWGCAQHSRAAPPQAQRPRRHGGWRPPRGQARRAGRQAAGCRPAGTAGRRTRLVFRHTTAAHAEPGHATCGAESTRGAPRRLSPWSRPMYPPRRPSPRSRPQPGRRNWSRSSPGSISAPRRSRAGCRARFASATKAPPWLRSRRHGSMAPTRAVSGSW